MYYVIQNDQGSRFTGIQVLREGLYKNSHLKKYKVTALDPLTDSYDWLLFVCYEYVAWISSFFPRNYFITLPRGAVVFLCNVIMPILNETWRRLIFFRAAHYKFKYQKLLLLLRWGLDAWKSHIYMVFMYSDTLRIFKSNPSPCKFNGTFYLKTLFELSPDRFNFYLVLSVPVNNAKNC